MNLRQIAGNPYTLFGVSGIGFMMMYYSFTMYSVEPTEPVYKETVSSYDPSVIEPMANTEPFYLSDPFLAGVLFLLGLGIIMTMVGLNRAYVEERQQKMIHP